MTETTPTSMGERGTVDSYKMVLELVKENVELKAQLEAANIEKDRLKFALEEQKKESKQENSKLNQSIQHLQEKTEMLNVKLHEIQEMRIIELKNKMVENLSVRCESMVLVKIMIKFLQNYERNNQNTSFRTFKHILSTQMKS